MEILERLGSNPLIVSIMTVIITSSFAGIGYLIKRKLTNKDEKKMIKKENNKQEQNNQIIQNFNSMSYHDVKEIASEVYETKVGLLEEKLERVIQMQQNERGKK